MNLALQEKPCASTDQMPFNRRRTVHSKVMVAMSLNPYFGRASAARHQAFSPVRPTRLSCVTRCVSLPSHGIVRVTFKDASRDLTRAQLLRAPESLLTKLMLQDDRGAGHGQQGKHFIVPCEQNENCATGWSAGDTEVFQVYSFSLVDGYVGLAFVLSKRKLGLTSTLNHRSRRPSEEEERIALRCLIATPACAGVHGLLHWRSAPFQERFNRSCSPTQASHGRFLPATLSAVAARLCPRLGD